MPKRRRANAIVFEKRSSNNNDARNDNPLATVFIDDQRFDSGSSETNSSDSSSESEDNHLSKRSRKSSKKNTCDCRNYYRKLQSQIDLFQRNNDMKLNYIESLLQNLIKANNPPSTSIVSSSNNVNTSVANIKNPIQSSQIKPAISMKRPSVPVDPPQQFDNEADEIIDFDVPKFPIIGKI